MIAIIGAGITGLTLAYTLKDAGLEVALYEKSDHVGGNIQSRQVGPYLLDMGPNSLQTNSRIEALIQSLGLEDEKLNASPLAKHRFILKDGSYHAMPSGPLSLLGSEIISVGTLWRLWRERSVTPNPDEDESLESFVRRRFGDRLMDYAAGPFVSGVYAGDPAQIIAGEAFPKLKDYEREYGSVIRGFMKAPKKPKGPKGLISFRDGLARLPAQLAEKLGSSLHTERELLGIQRSFSGWELDFGNEKIFARAVVFCLPAHPLAALLDSLYLDFAELLKAVYYPPVAVVHSAFRREDVRHKLDGFGALHNLVEPSFSLGTLFSSTLYDGRCPGDQVLLTSFVGGSRHPERAALSDEEMLEGLYGDYRKYLGLEGEPEFWQITRWERAIPQPDKHKRTARLAARSLDAEGLHFAGNWQSGISVPDCIDRGLELADLLIGEEDKQNH